MNDKKLLLTRHLLAYQGQQNRLSSTEILHCILANIILHCILANILAMCYFWFCIGFPFRLTSFLSILIHTLSLLSELEPTLSFACLFLTLVSFSHWFQPGASSVRVRHNPFKYTLPNQLRNTTTKKYSKTTVVNRNDILVHPDFILQSNSTFQSLYFNSPVRESRLSKSSWLARRVSP